MGEVAQSGDLGLEWEADRQYDYEAHQEFPHAFPYHIPKQWLFTWLLYGFLCVCVSSQHFWYNHGSQTWSQLGQKSDSSVFEFSHELWDDTDESFTNFDWFWCNEHARHVFDSYSHIYQICDMFVSTMHDFKIQILRISKSNVTSDLWGATSLLHVAKITANSRYLLCGYLCVHWTGLSRNHHDIAILESSSRNPIPSPIRMWTPKN